MVCICGHDKHAWTDPTVCCDVKCQCTQFREASEERPVIVLSQKYFEQYEKIQDRMKWVLDNWRWFRNYTNKDLVIMWWKFINNWDSKKQLMNNHIYDKLDEPETITRVRRLLVEKNPELYGPFLPSIQEHKIIKQYGIMEFVIEQK